MGQITIQTEPALDSNLTEPHPSVQVRNTKIVCTAGPACQSPEKIRQLIIAGTNVFRLNFSHADHAWHSKMIDTIRQQADELQRPVAILQDLCGPKIRLSQVPDGEMVLTEGDLVRITTDHHLNNDRDNTIEFDLASTYHGLIDDVSVGSRMLLDDGRIHLEVIEKQDLSILTRVDRGGKISTGKGINLPGLTLSTESVTAKDWEDLELGIQKRVDFIALSFVRHPEDLAAVRERMDQVGCTAHLIAKIERPEAIEHLHDILEIADGIMVARGDLGLETDLASVPILQKRLIRMCQNKCKPVITATQMLESMVQDSTPTRAEVSDVANAIYDGSDAIMLSGETANGKYPVEATAVLHRIATTTESDLATNIDHSRREMDHQSVEESLVEAAAISARSLNAVRVIVYSQSGRTARLIARYRLPMPVVVVTNNTVTSRQLSLSYGLEPIYLPDVIDFPQLLMEMDRLTIEQNWGTSGDHIVVISALDGHEGNTDTIHIYRVR